MRNSNYASLLKIGVSATAMLYCTATYAQPIDAAATGQDAVAPVVDKTATSDESGDIIVTAQKRSERLQDVPLSVQAITPAILAKTGAETTQSLQNLVPGLSVSDNVSGFKPFLRGVGSATSAAGNENSVSTYIDNIYLASMNAGLLNLSSIEAIEVLKGPQGTLFGRNATGGVINIRTRKPTQEFSGEGTLKYGNYKTLIASGYVTGGLTENLAADLAVYYRDQGDGYGHNLHTGSEVNKDRSFTVRSKILFTPTSVDTVTLAADYSHVKSSGNTYRPVPGSNVHNWDPNAIPVPTYSGAYFFPENGGYWDVDLATDPRFKQWAWGVSLTYEHEFSWATLSSFTAYRESEVDQAWNSVPLPTNAAYAGWIQPEDQFSQEFQLSSLPSSPVKWILGAYYLKAHVQYDPFFISGLSASFQGAPSQTQFRMKQTIESPALYGQVTAPIEALGDTNVTAGLRYTKDKRSIVGHTEIIPQPQPNAPVVDPSGILFIPPAGLTDASKKYSTFTWRLGIDHHVTPDTMIYATYNRGFKAGSYNSIPPGGPTATPTNPEYLDAYEIGIKNTLFGGKLTANVSAFYYDYKDLQVTLFNGFSAQTVNAAAARIKGIDVDLTARVTRELTLSFGGEFLDHKFVDYPAGPILAPGPDGGVIRTFGDLSGKRLPYTANTSITAGADYRAPISIGTFEAAANFNYNSGYSFEPSDAVPRPSFIDLSGSIGLTLNNKTTNISIYGRNITNEHAPKIAITGGNPGGYYEVQYRPPRTYGVSLSQRF